MKALAKTFLEARGVQPPSAAASTTPPMCGFTRERHKTRSLVTLQSPPAPPPVSRNPAWDDRDSEHTRHSGGRSTTQPKDAIRTASVSPRWFFDDHARGWADSARTTSHRSPSDINLELAQRISSSLHRDSPRAILRGVRLTATPYSPATDDRYPVWDPDPTRRKKHSPASTLR